jgi:phage tail sheath protein FI
VVEDYPTLTLDDTTPYYCGKQINGNSSLISVSGSDDTTENPFVMPTAADGVNIALSGGSDGGTPSDDDYVGVDNGPGLRSGIQALEDIEDISIIAAPGITSQIVLNALINQCTLLKYRFAILDPMYDLAKALDNVQAQRQLYDTTYAALYYPRVIINDPLTQTSIPAPPSGHIAGIYARTDNERGVYKAPANEIISGILDLELLVNKREQEILNPPPNQINVLRDFRHAGRGLRVWGARCITSDALWKYVNVRRLFIFIEASIDRGTQWVVFEPNDYQLWARVTQSVSNFLTSVWHDGALMGAKVEDAFFVRCDSTTMTQNDIDNGRLIMLIGIAPVKPAEFVIFRISQYTAAASTT